MRTVTQAFFATTARDLMSGEVITIPREMSVPGAAHLLRQYQISGAPVVDADGRCIGVFSRADFVSWADREGGAPVRGRRELPCAHSAWQVMDNDTGAPDQVGQYMTQDPVTVPPDSPIGDLARMMTDVHIHRVIVVDAEGRPVGVVSSTDVLAALAGAAERQTAGQRW